MNWIIGGACAALLYAAFFLFWAGRSAPADERMRDTSDETAPDLYERTAHTPGAHASNL